jgi:hypothetical protein
MEAGERKCVKGANPKPCAQCPWRLANQGTPHPHGFYTKANLRRLWGGLKRGERMTCHPTDPEMAEFEGYEKTADREVTHECAGALIIVQREFMRAQRAMQEADAEGKRDGLKRYRAAHPKGLMRDGVFAVVERAMFGGSALDRLAMAKPDLNEPGIGHPDLVAWDPTTEG